MVKKLSDTQVRVLEKEAISCRDVTRLLGEYADAELTPTVKARLDAHIRCCEECQEVKESYLWTIEMAHELKDSPVPAGMHARLRKALNERLGINLPVVQS